MKSVNVAELKNKLSLYLDQVELGEEIMVRNRKRIVARIAPVDLEETSEVERELVIHGELKLPVKSMSNRFLQKFLAAKMPRVRGGTSVEALIKDRNER